MSRQGLLELFCYVCFLTASMLFLPSNGAYAAPQESGYHVVRTVHLGGQGRWDYLIVDPDSRRIYISRTTHVMVVDENSLKVIGDIPNTRGVHGIALAPELGKGFTSVLRH